MDAQVVAAVEEERGAVASVEFDEVRAADDVARVVRNRDDQVEHNVLGQHVEEVLTVHGPRKAVLDRLAADGGDDRAASPTVIAPGPVSAYSVPGWASGSASFAAAHERLSGHASLSGCLIASSGGCVSGTTCGGAQGRNSFLDNATRRYRGVGHP